MLIKMKDTELMKGGNVTGKPGRANKNYPAGFIR